MEKKETNRLLKERIQESKDAIENVTKRLHAYKQRLNRMADTELGRIAILFVEQQTTIDQKYKKHRILLTCTGIGLVLVSVMLYILGELSLLSKIGIITCLIAVSGIVLIIIVAQLDENKFQYRQFKRIYKKQAGVNAKYRFSKELFTEHIQPTMEQYMELSSFIEEKYPIFVENNKERIKCLESRFR